MNAHNSLDRKILPFERQSREPFDARWKALTELGNAAFRAGDHDLAGLHYGRALQEARRVFTRTRQGQDLSFQYAVPMLVVASGNAARNFVELDRCAEAESEGRRLLADLVHDMQQQAVDMEIRETCARHLPRALVNVIETLAAAEVEKAVIKQLVEETRRSALDFWNARQQ